MIPNKSMDIYSLALTIIAIEARIPGSIFQDYKNEWLNEKFWVEGGYD